MTLTSQYSRHENEMLLVMKRKYSEHEELSILVKRIKELEFELGVVKSERDEFKSESERRDTTKKVLAQEQRRIENLEKAQVQMQEAIKNQSEKIKNQAAVINRYHTENGVLKFRLDAHKIKY